LSARIPFYGHAQGTGKRLKTGLDNMVGIEAGSLANVQSELGVVDHRLIKLPHQLGFVAANALRGQLQAIAEVRTPGEIQHHLHQSFIQRCPKMAEAMNATPILQSLRQGLSQRDAHIFVGVVIVDVQIPYGLDLQVDQPVGAELGQHVIQKGDPSIDLMAPAAIQVQMNLDIRFSSATVNRGRSGLEQARGVEGSHGKSIEAGGKSQL
jgi:hypothetical protein